MSITCDSFQADSHGATYRGVLDKHGQAADRFLALLNQPCNEHRLLDAEALGHPALAGIVRFLDADEIVGPVVSSDLRFRQAVGVGVRLKMEELGWSKTGTKGPISSPNFSRAERYTSK